MHNAKYCYCKYTFNSICPQKHRHPSQKQQTHPQIEQSIDLPHVPSLGSRRQIPPILVHRMEEHGVECLVVFRHLLRAIPFFQRPFEVPSEAAIPRLVQEPLRLEKQIEQNALEIVPPAGLAVNAEDFRGLLLAVLGPDESGKESESAHEDGPHGCRCEEENVVVLQCDWDFILID